ncbi:MAG: GC-type dockerin domain-anchored protein [Planctomycetota bacterium]
MRRVSIQSVLLLASSGLFAQAVASTPVDPIFVNIGIESGLVWSGDSEAEPADAQGRVVVFEHTIDIAGGAWMRVDFGAVELGEAPRDGAATIVRLTSTHDGAQQQLEARHVYEWAHMSAFFNGGSVRVEVLSDPMAEPSSIEIDRVLVQPGYTFAPDLSAMAESICGSSDDRELSSDPRVARGWTTSGSANCTAWIIDDCMKCVLAAGHCGFSQIHFNNPLSTPGGVPVMPHPDDQYTIDRSSEQEDASGVGRDWYYGGAFANPNTGLTPFEAQGDAFELAQVIPPVDGRDIRVTGHGVTGSGVDPTWFRAQKTHTGPFVDASGTSVRYAMDTTSGNSGSPVIDDTTGLAIGVHTHGGCSSSGGSNAGTAITAPALQAALASPSGICVNPCPADLDCNALLDIFDFLEFSNLFSTSDARADLDGDGVLTVLDFLAFQNSFDAGCP